MTTSLQATIVAIRAELHAEAARRGLSVVKERSASERYEIGGIGTLVTEGSTGSGWHVRKTGFAAVDVSRVVGWKSYHTIERARTFAATDKKPINVAAVIDEIVRRSKIKAEQDTQERVSRSGREAFDAALTAACPALPAGMRVDVSETGYAVAIRVSDAATVARIAAALADKPAGER